MAAIVFISLFSLLLLVNYVPSGEAIMCHRCMSSMGGCGDNVVWRMYPWRDCGDSFCVKVIEHVKGEEPKYIRECEKYLLKATKHRLRMPVLRRHGYCLPARKNDPHNPLSLTDSNIEYCFCNDWNGCNSAVSKHISFNVLVPLVSLATFLIYRTY